MIEERARTTAAAALLLIAIGCNRDRGLELPGDSDLHAPAEGIDLGASDMAAHDSRDLAVHEAHDLAVHETPDLAVRDLALPPAPPYDGVCTPGAMATSVYDPDCIYLYGTLQVPVCAFNAFVFPPNPDDWVVGFSCTAAQGLIRPGDGRFLYSDGVATGLALEFTVDDGPRFAQYPTMVQANDTDLHAGCPDGVWLVYAFRDGTPAWRCYNSGDVLHVGDAATTRALTGDPIALGAGRAVLMDESPGLAIVDDTARMPVTGLATAQTVMAARSTENGFRVVLKADSGAFTLYQIDLTGVASSLGDYRLGSGLYAVRGCVLEPGGALQCFTQYEPPPTLHDLITRFTTSDEPVVIYDEALHAVNIHVSQLVTGP